MASGGAAMTERPRIPALPAEVQGAFERYPVPVRERLLAVRALIYETAMDTDGVGPLTETLKWGEPAYLTEETGSGSTIRLGVVRDAPETAAVFVNCRTTLVDSFRSIAPDLDYRGDRALLLPAAGALPVDSLRRCLALALAYKQVKRVARPRRDPPKS